MAENLIEQTRQTAPTFSFCRQRWTHITLFNCFTFWLSLIARPDICIYIVLCNFSSFLCLFFFSSSSSLLFLFDFIFRLSLCGVYWGSCEICLTFSWLAFEDWMNNNKIDRPKFCFQSISRIRLLAFAVCGSNLNAFAIEWRFNWLIWYFRWVAIWKTAWHCAQSQDEGKRLLFSSIHSFSKCFFETAKFTS